MPTYSYRRDLTAEDRTKALGIGAAAGVGVALAAAYLAGILMQRAPLRPGAPTEADVVCPPDRG